MKKIVFIIISVILLTVASFSFIAFFVVSNVENEDAVLFLPKGAHFEQMIDSMAGKEILANESYFRWAAKIMRFRTVQPGRYTFPKESNNREIIHKLRKGQHYPVRLTFNNIRTKEQFVEKIDHHFLFNPEELEHLLQDPLFLKPYGFTPDNVLTCFIPDSYDIFYDITAEEFFNRMFYYYKKFWNEERQAIAAKIGFSPVEISIIASIVEEENLIRGEEAMIAGVYINRLKKGMRLQADPTVKYASGNFLLKRVLYEHLAIDSPYNTYLYDGLPPGPIRLPEKSTIDSVLNYTRHNYLYMCAKEDFSGRHNFARTQAEHARNAKKYHQALNQRKIK